MSNFCTRCGARLAGPVCANCNQPDVTMPLAPARRRRRWYRSTAALVIGASALVLLVAAGTFLLVHPFASPAKPVAAVAPKATTPAPPSTMVAVPQPAPRTVTAPAPAPRAPVAAAGESDGDSVPYADALIESCGLDATGSHLTATVWVSSGTDHAMDVIGTVTFTDSDDGTWLGTGGFSAASLAAYDSIDTYVDTSDPADHHASEGADAVAASGGAVACEVSDMHYR